MFSSLVSFDDVPAKPAHIVVGYNSIAAVEFIQISRQYSR